MPKDLEFYLEPDYAESSESIYYNPEKFNLEEVAQHDFSSGSYEFDYRVVWRDKTTGKLYTARDSGCSCPTPFESLRYKDLEDFSLSYLLDEANDSGGGFDWKETLRNLTYKGKK